MLVWKKSGKQTDNLILLECWDKLKLVLNLFCDVNGEVLNKENYSICSAMKISRAVKIYKII